MNETVFNLRENGKFLQPLLQTVDLYPADCSIFVYPHDSKFYDLQRSCEYYLMAFDKEVYGDVAKSTGDMVQGGYDQQELCRPVHAVFPFFMVVIASTATLPEDEERLRPNEHEDAGHHAEDHSG